MSPNKSIAQYSLTHSPQGCAPYAPARILCTRCRGLKCTRQPRSAPIEVMSDLLPYVVRLFIKAFSLQSRTLYSATSELASSPPSPNDPRSPHNPLLSMRGPIHEVLLTTAFLDSLIVLPARSCCSSGTSNSRGPLWSSHAERCSSVFTPVAAPSPVRFVGVG